MVIQSKEQAYAMIVQEEQMELLTDMRDELYHGKWDKMVADMEKGIRNTRNPQTRHILQRDLEIIANSQSTE